MRQPAARITKMHVCPTGTPGGPPIAHVGGPIVVPVAPTVLVCRPPAARLGEPSVHGGTIVLGAPTVFVGG